MSARERNEREKEREPEQFFSGLMQGQPFTLMANHHVRENTSMNNTSYYILYNIDIIPKPYDDTFDVNQLSSKHLNDLNLELSSI